MKVKKIAAGAALITVFASCAPTAERRPVSLREKVAPAGELPGEIAYVQDLAVGESAIYMKDLSTNARAQLNTPPGYAGSPSWSPDGTEIAYSVTDPKGFSNIWVSSRTGSPTRVTSGNAIDDYPSWSPDGKELVFASIRKNSDDWRLFTTGRNGMVEQVGPTSGQSVYPDWSPDGDRVVFSHRSDGNFKLHILDISTGDVTQLTDGGGDDLFPQWSPDGDRVAFSSNSREKVWQIYVLEVDSGDVTRVIGSDSLDRFPVWSPDGEYLALSANHLAVYRSDGESLESGVLRYKLTSSRAITPTWR